MDLSSDGPELVKLDSHSFREICNYLETRDLLNVWSINDRRICALLRRCDAFGLLKLSIADANNLLRALTWMKTLDKPRIKRLLFESPSSTLSLSARQLMGNCTFETVVFKPSCFEEHSKTLEKWHQLRYRDSQTSSILHGTTTLTFEHPHRLALSLRFLPATLTSLSVKGGKFGDWLRHFSAPNLTTLILDKASLMISYDPSLSTAPLLLHGLASAAPSLTKLKLTVSYEQKVIPLFEVPPKVTDLRLTSREECSIPIIVWPTKRGIQRLELTWWRGSSQRELPLAPLAHRFNLYFLKHTCPDLARLAIPRRDDSTSDAYSRASWNAFEKHVGQPMMDRLLPPGYTFDTALESSNPSSLLETLTIRSILSNLPPSITSMLIASESTSDLRSILALLKQYPLPHLSKLTLYFQEEVEDSPMIQLPSTITHLVVEGTVTAYLAGSILPPSLTRIDARMTIAARLLIREKFGPSIQLSSNRSDPRSVVTLDSALLSLLYPDLEHKPTPNSAPNSSEVDMQVDWDGFEVAPPAPNHNPIMSSYGPCDERDAHGDWIVTYSGLQNALARVLGHRTSACFNIPESSVWPLSVAKLFLTRPKGYTGCSTGINLANCFGTLSSDSVATLLETHSTPSIIPWTIETLRISVDYGVWDNFQFSYLTELIIPTRTLQIQSCRLPSGLRILSFKKVASTTYDYEVRNVLRQPTLLEKVSFDLNDVVLTAPDWTSTTFSASTTAFAECLRPHINTEMSVTLLYSPGVTVSVKELPRHLTSLNLLGGVKSLDGHDLPTGLTSYSDVYGYEIPQFANIPLLQEYHCFQYGGRKLLPLPYFPSSLRNLCVSTNSYLFEALHASHAEGPLYSLAEHILPCAPYLHTLIAPQVYLSAFTAKLTELDPLSVLPNLTRLVISGQDCADLDLYHILLQSYPKLRRLTLTSYVNFTGQLVDASPSSSTSSTVSFRTLFNETRMALQRLLESRLDIQDNRTTMIPEINIVLSLGAYHGSTPKFIVPPYSQHASLLCGKPSQSKKSLPIDYLTLDTLVADTIESEVCEGMNSWPPYIERGFVWSSIINYSDLKCLVDVEYESRVPYTPGDFFQYSTLKRLKIHAPIVVLDDETSQNTCLKYGKWQLPPGLTHLVVTKALRSFEFVFEDSSQSPSLSIVELPQATWQHEDMMLSSIVKVVVHDCHPRGLMDEVISKGCEVVLTSHV